ncbi:glycosyltransferase family 4 protein [Spirosoma rigui]|uniref:glycosyltransferase family 4 protein n=1 Tax=Spirosoma rigui TaxID=564064 RepID=UPI0009B093E9|nr:glycosyltransferase family 4 protein [Spirosoma rigui]
MPENRLDERNVTSRRVTEKTHVVFINSHPIQYFVPLYQQIACQEAGVLDLTVLYLSDETTTGYIDTQFGARIEWDIPLLDGYKHRFVKNDSWKPSFYNGFLGLLNWGLIGELRRMKKSIVISHGWAYASNILSLWVAKAFGHTVCMRGDSPYCHERYKSKLHRITRLLFLKVFVLSVTDKFLYVGEQNRRLYKSFGIPDHKLIFVPHAVDNNRFRLAYLTNRDNRDTLRRQMGLEGKKVILYVGKLIPKKRPIDLLQAYEQLCQDHDDVVLLYVGDGILRAEIETYCSEHSLTGVHITGFVNQTDMPCYYAIAEVFVMCSGVGETWGLAVNEAMNFGLPVVVSDLTGCAEDLVKSGSNGLVFTSGDIGALVHCLQQILYQDQIDGRESIAIVERYSYDQLIDGLSSIPL